MSTPFRAMIQNGQRSKVSDRHALSSVSRTRAPGTWTRSSVLLFSDFWSVSCVLRYKLLRMRAARDLCERRPTRCPNRSNSGRLRQKLAESVPTPAEVCQRLESCRIRTKPAQLFEGARLGQASTSFGPGKGSLDPSRSISTKFGTESTKLSLNPISWGPTENFDKALPGIGWIWPGMCQLGTN